MPHYFFHTADGGTDRDESGTDLAGDAEARAEAIRYAGAVIEDQPGLLDDAQEFRVLVTDGAGDLLFTVSTRVVDEKPTRRG